MNDSSDIRANVSVHPDERTRVETQARLILERLRRGRTPASDLAAIALQYNARVFELRKAGYRITCVERNRKTGETWYELSEPEQMGLWAQPNQVGDERC